MMSIFKNFIIDLDRFKLILFKLIVEKSIFSFSILLKSKIINLF